MTKDRWSVQDRGWMIKSSQKTDDQIKTEDGWPNQDRRSNRARRQMIKLTLKTDDQIKAEDRWSNEDRS